MPGAFRFEVAVIGGGPAGLMAAEVLARGGAGVTVYDRMPSVGRKFLLAGRGGLNLTHSDDFEHFLARYGDAEARLRPAIQALSPTHVRAWCEALGQETFVGSSGRVFPKAMKASPLLRAWLRRLAAQGVAFKLRHHWQGWDDDGSLLFASPQGDVVINADAIVLALGGASWPRLGSDGAWVEAMAKRGIAVAPLRPANCGFIVRWSDLFASRFEGQPLKSIVLCFGGRSVRGEALITRTSLEGGGIYALSAALRDAIAACGEATLQIDLRPDDTSADLERRLAVRRGKRSLSTFLRKTASLSSAAIALLQESAIVSSTRLADLGPVALARLIKAVPVRLTSAAPVARAISTAGGVAFEGVDEHFMLRRHPGTFVAGEMLDWEAPTGGYLLQAAFATGAAAGRGALQWIARFRQT